MNLQNQTTRYLSVVATALVSILISGCTSSGASGCNDCAGVSFKLPTVPNSEWPWSDNYYPPTRYPIPHVMPLGSIVRSHWHVMQENAEASDFVIYRNEFVGSTSELTPGGLDHIAEISARMPSTPFPVVVQRSMNNADPELDAVRWQLIVRLLADMGNFDAARRVFVAEPYSREVSVGRAMSMTGGQ